MKNIAIGCASGQVGKRQVHGIEGEPPADWNAWPAKEKLMELMADSAKATMTTSARESLISTSCATCP